MMFVVLEDHATMTDHAICVNQSSNEFVQHSPCGPEGAEFTDPTSKAWPKHAHAVHEAPVMSTKRTTAQLT